MTRTFARMALAAVVGGAIWSLRCKALERLAEKPKAKPPQVETWEGEGGALRSTGAQMGPDPSLPTTTSPTY